jgi:CDP-diacylglycerol--glycerol-3-phosphate 3-phosphatidyltransferase
MTLANKITTLRIVLAPVFFIVYMIPLWVSPFFHTQAILVAKLSRWTIPVLWVLFVVSELTDLVDGMAARMRKEVSDFGKLYDPFADVLVQVTYFLCFVSTGIFPAALFLLVLYREIGILFVRNLMLRKGIAMGARMGGKLKTVTYILAGALALLAVSIQRLGLGEPVFLIAGRIATAVFLVSVLFSLLSFADYLSVYRKS